MASNAGQTRLGDRFLIHDLVMRVGNCPLPVQSYQNYLETLIAVPDSVDPFLLLPDALEIPLPHGHGSEMQLLTGWKRVPQSKIGNCIPANPSPKRQRGVLARRLRSGFGKSTHFRDADPIEA